SSACRLGTCDEAVGPDLSPTQPMSIVPAPDFDWPAETATSAVSAVTTRTASTRFLTDLPPVVGFRGRLVAGIHTASAGCLPPGSPRPLDCLTFPRSGPPPRVVAFPERVQRGTRSDGVARHQQPRSRRLHGRRERHVAPALHARDDGIEAPLG